MTESPPAGGTTPPANDGKQFVPIESQADLDRVIRDRLERERSKFADYDDLKARASKLDEIEEAAKTELEKAVERATAAEQKAAELAASAQITEWKAKVSEDTGVPVSVLAGSTLDELTAHAEQVKTLMAPTTPPKPTPLVVPAVGKTPPALNSSKLEESLRRAVGAS